MDVLVSLKVPTGNTQSNQFIQTGFHERWSFHSPVMWPFVLFIYICLWILSHCKDNISGSTVECVKTIALTSNHTYAHVSALCLRYFLH